GVQLVSPVLMEDFGVFRVLFAIAFLAFVLQTLATGAIVRVVEQEFVDRRVGVLEALGHAGGRFGALMGASLLTNVLVFVGCIMCIAPGLIFAVWYAFVAQAVMVENKGGAEALGRSKSLVEGYGGRVFGILLLFLLLYGVGTLVSVALDHSLPGIEFVPRQG